MSPEIQICPDRISDWAILSSVEVPGQNGERYTISGITPRFAALLPDRARESLCRLENGSLFHRTTDKAALWEEFGKLMHGESRMVSIPDKFWARYPGVDPTPKIDDYLNYPPSEMRVEAEPSEYKLLTVPLDTRLVAQIRYAMLDSPSSDVFFSSYMPNSYFVPRKLAVARRLNFAIQHAVIALERDGYAKEAQRLRSIAYEAQTIINEITHSGNVLETWLQLPLKDKISMIGAGVLGLAAIGRIAFGYFHPGGSVVLVRDIRTVYHLFRHPVRMAQKAWRAIMGSDNDRGGPPGAGGGPSGGLKDVAPALHADGKEVGFEEPFEYRIPAPVALADDAFDDSNIFYSRQEFLGDMVAVSVAAALGAVGIAAVPLFAAGESSVISGLVAAAAW